MKKLKKKLEDDYKAMKKKATESENGGEVAVEAEGKPKGKGGKGKGKQQAKPAIEKGKGEASCVNGAVEGDEEDEASSKAGAAASSELAKIPSFNPTHAQVAAALEALLEVRAHWRG